MDDLTKAQLREKLNKLIYAMKEWNSIVDTHASEIKKIEAKRGVWDPDFIEAQKSKVPGLDAIKAQQREKVNELAADFAEFYKTAINQPLDPERIGPLNNAIQLIQTGVLDYEAARLLNRSFEGDQVALKLLKNAYDKVGTPSGGGGIDKMVMPLGPSDIQDGLKRSAYHVLYEGGLPSHFGKAVKTVADYLALDVDTAIKPNAMTAALRAGANLPESE